MLPSFNLSLFQLCAIVLVIVEALTDSVVDSVVYIIAYPMYYHLPVGGGVITYIGAYFIPSKRVYRFIVILYIPVLCLWRAGRKVLVRPKQLTDAICASDLDLCLDAENDTKKNDDSGSRGMRSRRNSGRKTSSRTRRTFQGVLPVVHSGRVCWRAATHVCQQFSRCTRKVVVPLGRVYGIGALKGGLNSAWRLVQWRRHNVQILDGNNEEEEDVDGWINDGTENLLDLSDTEEQLQSLYERGEDISGVEGNTQGSRSVSYGELVHLKSERHRGVLKQYPNRWSLYRKMPLKTASRVWGRLCRINLPVWLRTPALSLYIWLFGCSLHEAAVRDLRLYRNLSEFFRRRLRPGVRPVNKFFELTSPADGKVLYCGAVDGGSLEQVKGVTYSLKGFLGPLDSLCLSTCQNNQTKVCANRAAFTIGDGVSDIYKQIDTVEELCLSEEVESLEIADGYVQGFLEREGEEDGNGEEIGYLERLLMDKSNCLYQCIIYLAPGDYHRFHSPADWTVYARRHFPGELFSVNPGIARWLQGLFNFNERAVYVGKWKHGFFSMAAVGATNVGSINVDFDEDLVTNTSSSWENGCFYDVSFASKKADGIRTKKGNAFGDFNLGSTIVLLFEASPDFQFTVRPDQRVKYGQALGMSIQKKRR